MGSQADDLADFCAELSKGNAAKATELAKKCDVTGKTTFDTTAAYYARESVQMVQLAAAKTEPIALMETVQSPATHFALRPRQFFL